MFPNISRAQKNNVPILTNAVIFLLRIMYKACYKTNTTIGKCNLGVFIPPANGLTSCFRLQRGRRDKLSITSDGNTGKHSSISFICVVTLSKSIRRD